MKRKIIIIDEKKCTGCGLCIPNCPEGAIQIIDGKARLVSDLFCDGLGACLGNCPEGAISIEERDASPYDERRVMENVVNQGKSVIIAHIKHLKEHNETEYLKDALAFLSEHSIEINELDEKPKTQEKQHTPFAGCPGSRSMRLGHNENKIEKAETDSRTSHLGHWPIQLHLISPSAQHYKGSDMLLAADCVAFSVGDFHKDFLKGKTLAIACPKLDDGKEIYLEKLVSLIDDAQINTLTVMVMQVPCCGGLLHLAQQAVQRASRPIPIKAIVVGINGEVLSEQWVMKNNSTETTHK
jgi:Pyruvate/2-oxoacid:ferredoxin oxidoreductase delta subunit